MKKQLYNISKGYDHKPTGLEPGAIQHYMETHHAVELTNTQLAHRITNGSSISVGLLEPIDHDNIDWTRIDQKNYIYVVLDGILHKRGGYEKIAPDYKVFKRDENGKKIPYIYKRDIKVINYRKRDENFKEASKVYFDFDKEITVEMGIEMATKANLPISIFYTTFNHLKKQDEYGNKIHKFRIIHDLPFIIKDKDTFSSLIVEMGEGFYKGKYDPAVKNAVNLLHGTHDKADILVKEDTFIPLEIITDLLNRNKNLKWNITNGVLFIEQEEIKKGRKRSKSSKKKVYSIESLSETVTNTKLIKEHYSRYKGHNELFSSFIDGDLPLEGTHNIILGIGYAWLEMGFPINHWVTLANYRVEYKGLWEGELLALYEDENRDGAWISKEILSDMGFIDFTQDNHEFVINNFWGNVVGLLPNYEKVIIEGDYIKEIYKYLPVHEKIKEPKVKILSKREMLKKLKKKKKGLKELPKGTLEFPKPLKQLRTLIIAETGLGKTTTIMGESLNIPKLTNLQIALVQPNTAISRQLHIDFGDQGGQYFYGKKKNYLGKDKNGKKVIKQFISLYDRNKGIACSTWDSAKSILRGARELDILYIDEIHTNVLGAGYRRNALKILNQLIKISKHVVYITATPDLLNLEDFDKIIHFVKEEEETNNTPIKINILYNKHFSELPKRDMLNKELKGTIIDYMVDNRRKVKEFSESIPTCLYMTSVKKFENKAFMQITEKSIAPLHFAHTGVTNQGVNYKNEAHVRIYLDNIRDSMIVKQYIARYRNALSIEVFLNLKPDVESEMSTPFVTFEHIRNEVERFSNDLAYTYNGFSEVDEGKYVIENVSLADGISMKNGKWVVAPIKIDELAYNRYLFQFKQLGYLWQLENYFDDVTIDLNEEKLVKTIEKIDEIYPDMGLYNDVTTIVNMKRDIDKADFDNFTLKKAYDLEQQGLSKKEIGEYFIISENTQIKRIIKWVHIIKKKKKKGLIHSTPDYLYLDFEKIYKTFKSYGKDYSMTIGELNKKFLKIKQKRKLKNRSLSSLLVDFKALYKLTKVGVEGKKPLYNIEPWTQKAIIEEIKKLELFKLIRFESEPQKEFKFNHKHYNNLIKVMKK